MCIRDRHHTVALDVSRLGKRLVVRFPDAVDDGRLSRIGWRAVIKLPAQIDDTHTVFAPLSCRCQAGFARTLALSLIHISVALECKVAQNMVGTDVASGRKQLARGTDIDVALIVECEVGA